MAAARQTTTHNGLKMEIMGTLQRLERPTTRGINPSAVREAEVVIADAEHVTLGDLLPRDPLAVVLDAVGRAHVDHEVDAVLVLDHRVLAGHVRVLQREVARLLAAADDEAILRHADLLALVDDAELRALRGERAVVSTTDAATRNRGHRAALAPRDRRRRAARRARRLRAAHARPHALHRAAHARRWLHAHP